MNNHPQFFDAHSHLNSEDYVNDLHDVLTRMRENRVYTVCVGTDFKSSKEAVRLAEENDDIFACIGVHPVDDPSLSFEVERFESLVSNPKVVAVGECGLDYFRTDPCDTLEKERQIALFKKQIEFALKHDKPIMVHARSAYDEIIDILTEYNHSLILENKRIANGEGGVSEAMEIRGNIHFFTGSVDQAKKFIDLGFTLSFAGPITFARNYDEVIKSIPANSILSETDSPLVAPALFRGKRNEPSYVVHIANKIAEIRGENKEEFQKQLVENALAVFNIKL